MVNKKYIALTIILVVLALTLIGYAANSYATVTVNSFTPSTPLPPYNTTISSSTASITLSCRGPVCSGSLSNAFTVTLGDGVSEAYIGAIVTAVDANIISFGIEIRNNTDTNRDTVAVLSHNRIYDNFKVTADISYYDVYVRATARAGTQSPSLKILLFVEYEE